jgi:chromate reductase, NAD(P)H dehydrogenase (quinone)
MQLLAISGSLRAGSSNTALLEAAQLLAPPDVDLRMYDGLAHLPAFNPDLDTIGAERLPRVVAELRAAVGRADGILISSPEYAHGIPGSLKNALDWLVGSVEFPGKPVALLTPSSRSTHAQAQLVEVLTTMNARLIREASLTVQLPSRTMDATAIVMDAELAPLLRASMRVMAQAMGDTEKSST